GPAWPRGREQELPLLLGWGSALQPGSCPAPCECSEAARTVQCVNGNLTAVPRDLPPYARLLCLTGNRLASLPPGAFLSPPLPDLQHLDLHNNSLMDLQAGTFHNLAQLQSLDLSHNSLKCLSNATVTQLRALPRLHRVRLDLQTQLQTSYVFLGIVLALIGAIFLLVLYLNRKGIKKLICAMWGICLHVM
uniref:Trophoblast glycoprotein n=1 Tax=Pelusios castaneus TaxID=367368 RepID=A0A8C8SKS6_9SAUR